MGDFFPTSLRGVDALLLSMLLRTLCLLSILLRLLIDLLNKAEEGLEQLCLPDDWADLSKGSDRMLDDVEFSLKIISRLVMLLLRLFVDNFAGEKLITEKACIVVFKVAARFAIR